MKVAGQWRYVYRAIEVYADPADLTQHLRETLSFSSSGVAQRYHAVSEAVFIEEIKVDARVGRQRRLAPTDDHGPDEQLGLINQPDLEHLRGEVRNSYGEVAAGRGLQLLYRLGSKWRSSRALAVETAARGLE